MLVRCLVCKYIVYCFSFNTLVLYRHALCLVFLVACGMWHVADWGAVPVHEQAQRHAALVRQHRGTYIVLVVDDDDDDGICMYCTDYPRLFGQQ